MCFAAVADDLKPLPERPHLILDFKSGEVLSSEKPFVRWAPASLTKLMTSYTVLKALKLQHVRMNSPVRVSEAALAQPPSKMGFPIGTILTVEAALQIIMVKSANDISVALGEAIAGSEASFVALMNSHARRLGMYDTRFVNTHGLHDPQQYTSARDMAVLTMAIIRDFPEHEALYNIPAIQIGARRLRNHNALLERFPGTVGMKTGYVCASGFNVVVRTIRERRDLIAVVFGGQSSLSRNVRTARLLTEGFNGMFQQKPVQFGSWERPAHVSLEPEDITFDLCPGKYPYEGLPDLRPDYAPKAPEETIVDIALDEAKLKVLEAREPVIAKPERSPSSTKITETSAQTEQEVAIEEALPTLRDLAKIYMTPRIKVRSDVRVELGGGVGPNPHGIKHTNGGAYVPPIPVPLRNPALDLPASTE